MKNRGSGILLHITSLPSPYGIGDMGPSAYEFADFLSASKQKYWQILPLNPVDPKHGNSPYHSSSAFAYNPLLISPEYLVRDGWLRQEDIEGDLSFTDERVNYEKAAGLKDILLSKAYEYFKIFENKEDYKGFCRRNKQWLDDFALFTSLKSYFKGKAWIEWPIEFRDRDPEAMRWAADEFHEGIHETRFRQYLFSEQWHRLKSYCNSIGVKIFGDIPIYVVFDSTEVWVRPQMFNLDENKLPITVAGVPPDYFSETGQLWGNPVYRWDFLKKQGYKWWIMRIRHNLELFDLARIDHFRGFVAYWEVPAKEKNAINGKWVDAPAIDFFNSILDEFHDLPIIAEDLGIITPDVVEIRKRFNFPGMKILLFAFGDDLATNPYVPHNLERDCVVYTGTHDNNTARGWFENETTPEIKGKIAQYIGKEVSGDNIAHELIRLSMMSVADTVIFPFQDLLGLGQEARMNKPATEDANWEWRFVTDVLTPTLKEHLLRMTEIYGRG